MRATLVVPFIVAAMMMLQEAQANVVSARASANDGNVAKNVLDGKLGTRWSAQNQNWIELTMDKAYDLSAVKIAFFKGNQRRSNFKIDVSTDRNTWKTVVARRQSSGSTLQFETFKFGVTTNCRYIRYTGYGNTVNTWNSITKFSVVKGGVAASLIDTVISLRKTGGDALYLTAERDKSNELIARAKKVGEWEQFLVEEHPSGGVGLKALSTGKYLQVQKNEQNTEIRARGASMKQWQRFQIHEAGTNRIALQSVFTGKFLQASHRVDKALVYPKGAKASTWETFAWSYVSNPAVPTPATPPSAPSPPSSNEFELPSGYQLISSFAGLLSAFGQSNKKFRMKPGYYTATSLLSDKVTVMRTTAKNSIYDFTDATIDMPVKLLSTMRGSVHTFASWKMEGSGNTFIGGTFVNTYAQKALNTKITNFKAYNENNENRPGGSNAFLRIWGDNAKFIGNTFIVRGSFPYGYGEIFGKGSGSRFGLKKHSGIQVVGNNALIDGVELYQKAFGHALFMQGADGTVIRNSKFEGEMRLGAEMYGDGKGSLPDQNGYKVHSPEWYSGTAISRTTMYSLNEDGIRTYASGTKLDGTKGNTGAVTVESTSVTNLRSGLALAGTGKQASVKDVHVRGCSSGYSLPKPGGKIVDSTADAAFGPVIGIPYSNCRNGKFDITVVDAAYSTGDHNLANIAGSNNEVILRHDGKTPSTTSRRVKVGYGWDRWEMTGDDGQQATSGISITNYTPHVLELTKHSSKCTGKSASRIVDNGSKNSVSRM